MKKTSFLFFVIFLTFLCSITISTSHEIQQKSHSNVSEVKNKVSLTDQHDVKTEMLFAQLQTENEKAQAERREKLHEMIAWRLIKFLNLNEDQSSKFLPVFKESNKIRFKLLDEHRKLAGIIAKDLDDESVSTNDLKEQLARIEQIDKEIIKERENFLKKSEKILNERQFIKLKLFEDKLKNDLFQRFRGRPRRDEEDSERRK